MYALTLYNRYAAPVAATLATGVALAVFLYGALLLGAVSHAAGRTAAEEQLRALSIRMSTLEGEFLANTKALSPERAFELGFVPPGTVVTVYATVPALTLRY